MANMPRNVEEKKPAHEENSAKVRASKARELAKAIQQRRDPYHSDSTNASGNKKRRPSASTTAASKATLKKLSPYVEVVTVDGLDWCSGGEGAHHLI